MLPRNASLVLSKAWGKPDLHGVLLPVLCEATYRRHGAREGPLLCRRCFSFKGWDCLRQRWSIRTSVHRTFPNRVPVTIRCYLNIMNVCQLRERNNTTYVFQGICWLLLWLIIMWEGRKENKHLNYPCAALQREAPNNHVHPCALSFLAFMLLSPIREVSNNQNVVLNEVKKFGSLIQSMEKKRCPSVFCSAFPFIRLWDKIRLIWKQFWEREFTCLSRPSDIVELIITSRQSHDLTRRLEAREVLNCNVKWNPLGLM